MRRLTCLADGDVVAFCAGLVPPRVYVSAGAVQMLADGGLAGVVAHEATHARRRDPLRRLLGRSAADVLFFVPLVGWWAGRQRERAELSADRAALRAVDARALARALWASDGHTPAVAGVPGFEGAAQARVAQLLYYGAVVRTIKE